MKRDENTTEVFYMISGKGKLETPEENKEISVGDFAICPTGKESAHKIKNLSETENLVYIDFDTSNSPDIVHNQSGTFFKDDSTVDYYEGE